MKTQRNLRGLAGLILHPRAGADFVLKLIRFVALRIRAGRALRISLSPQKNQRTALLAGSGFIDGVKIELALIKGLELAGFRCIVVTRRDFFLERYYRLAGIRDFVWWDDYFQKPAFDEARKHLSRITSLTQLLAIDQQGVRVGRVTASTTLRRLRKGTVDLRDRSTKEELVRRLADAFAIARGAHLIVERTEPDLAIFVDRGYTPQGELFDVCLSAGIDVITWNGAHRSNALVLKRYGMRNRDEHFAALSDETWKYAQEMSWSETRRQRLYQELHDAYITGDWFAEVGTQFNKTLASSAQVSQLLELDPRKKTAVIFPHILWDGTFFWGEDLFDSYKDWLVETVQAATENDRVNWVVKIHPANVVKDARDGRFEEASELQAIREEIGELPPHFRVISPESPVNTWSLFSLMDYCLTVRGTIGIEAAMWGIPVLTAGSGRYDARGFTIDSTSADEYLGKVRNIDRIGHLTSHQRELAERYAYAVFVGRLLNLESVSLGYRRDSKASTVVRVHCTTRRQWAQARDLNLFANWLNERAAEDFIDFKEF